MEIKLFMRSLDQEFTDSISNWDNGWPYDVWPYDSHCDRWSYQSSNINPKSENNNYTNLRLRAEEFGGLLYDTKTKAIFYLDQEGFNTINFMIKGKTNHQIVEQLNISFDELKQFESKLKGFQIC
mgnify:CR=1 FL=1